jgi:hypothetical protein
MYASGVGTVYVNPVGMMILAVFSAVPNDPSNTTGLNIYVPSIPSTSTPLGSTAIIGEIDGVLYPAVFGTTLTASVNSQSPTDNSWFLNFVDPTGTQTQMNAHTHIPSSATMNFLLLL